MPSDIECTSAKCRFVSSGLFRRLYNMVEATFRQGPVNHITGDVHYITLLLRKKRTVLTVHDCRSMVRLIGIKRWLFRLMWLRLPSRRSAIVTVDSEFSRSELLRHVEVEPQRVRVVPVPFKPEFRPIPLRFNAGHPRILQLGSGSNKNIERLLEALQDVPCHLRLIGRPSTSQLNALRKYRIDYSAVERLSDSEIVDEYIRSDLVTFVSTYEGFGLPIVEANAVGRPVITSNICSMPEIAGGAACVVDPFDPESIRAGIVRIIRDESYRQELIERGYRNAERFSPRIVAAQYRRIYMELVQQV
jgi:glycosyltransferase involved in cell wall biosynthesis